MPDRESQFVSISDPTLKPIQNKVEEGIPLSSEDGLTLFTETALVVLDRVTTTNVERAVARLVEAGFFDHLAPLP